MAIRWRHVFGFMVCLITAVCASAQDRPPAPNLSLDQPLHFLSKEGNDILLQPGTYNLEAAEPRQLRLIPEDATPPITVEAVELLHDKDIRTPVTT